MRITISSTVLSKALRTAYRAVPAKAALPIMESFRLDASGTRLTVTATSGDLQVKAPARLLDKAQEEGVCSVPAKKLLDFVNLLPECVLSMVTEGDTMELKWTKGTTHLPLTAVDEFPEFRNDKGDPVTFDVQAQELLSALCSTIPSMSRDSARPVLNGVFFDVHETETRIVATDTRVLTYDTIHSGTSQGGQFTIPAQAANLLRSSITKDAAIARITRDRTSVCFNFGDVVIQTSLLEQKYPNYASVIPRNGSFSGEVVMSRDTLYATIKRLAAFSEKLRMKISPLAMTFSAQDTMNGTSAVEDCDCSYGGEEMEMGVSTSYVMTVLESIKSDNLCISVTDPSRPMVFRDADATDSGKLSLCMPLMLQQGSSRTRKN